ncbi:MAG: hypothetical protein EOP62_11770 [Sphingomonadales bacterium]|nr:MAG: hypothetical protein EOP62_11770 [Sphingomonadales bacterium]
MNDDLEKPGPKIGFFLGMAILVAALIIAGVIAASTTTEGIKNVALGVIGSLLASIVFSVLSEYADTPQSRVTEALRRSLGAVRDIEAEAKARVEAGVISVSDKRAHKPDYWFSILEAATSQLDMVGNSLSGWVHAEYRVRLKATVARILRGGGQVRIVLMDPDSDLAKAKTALLGKDYESAVRNFVNLLEELVHEFEESFDAGHLDIQLSKDDLTYMMIDNGRDIFVSPYMAVTRADHPLVVQIEGGSGYAEGYRADFEKLFSRSRQAAG